MKKILVPTDFSPIANKALDIAADIARKNNASIELLNVNVFPAHEVGVYYTVYSAIETIDDVWEKILADSKEKMDECINKHKDVDIKPFVVESNDRFVDELLNHPADLIVMGSHGAEGLKELMKGSNSEEVVRLANCPVLVIKSEDEAFNPKKVVFAVDLTQHEEFINKAVKNLPIENAEAHFVHIDTDMKFINYETVKLRMNKLAESLGFSNPICEIFESISVESGILDYTQKVNADLIVMYTHGRRGISHFFKGSIAEDVVNHSTKPIFTFVEH